MISDANLLGIENGMFRDKYSTHHDAFPIDLAGTILAEVHVDCNAASAAQNATRDNIGSAGESE